MGVSSIKSTDMYEFITTCIPMRSEVITERIFDEYQILTSSRNRKLLGTMVDYGVRSRYSNRCYCYVEIGLASGRVSSDISYLVEKNNLTCSEAYTLIVSKEPTHLSTDIHSDYSTLVSRVCIMLDTLKLSNAHFGQFYDFGGDVGWIECDSVGDNEVIDIKVTSNKKYNKEYWTQLLLYSLIAQSRDKIRRTTLVLLYPAQGVIMKFKYESQDYAAMCKEFNKRYLR